MHGAIITAAEASSREERIHERPTRCEPAFSFAQNLIRDVRYISMCPSRMRTADPLTRGTSFPFSLPTRT